MDPAGIEAFTSSQTKQNPPRSCVAAAGSDLHAKSSPCFHCSTENSLQLLFHAAFLPHSPSQTFPPLLSQNVVILAPFGFFQWFYCLALG